MKEKVWIYIPMNYKDKLDAWNIYYSYDTKDRENGDLVAYSLYTESKEYKDLVKFLNENNIYNYIFRRIYTFTRKEKENSEILRFWLDDDAKDSYTPEPISYKCNNCGNNVPLLNRSKLHVDYKRIKKYDMMITYNGDQETIVSEKVKQLFINENISGVGFEPIYQLGKENKIIEGFYHLILQEGIGKVVEPSIVEKGKLCPECGMYEYFVCKTTLNFKRETWKGLDICYTKDWFAGSPNFSKILIISNKLYKVLTENNIKNVYFQPAYFVD